MDVIGALGLISRDMGLGPWFGVDGTLMRIANCELRGLYICICT
jgi:hypothetical protein